ncbi:MAG: hypothetical protein ACQGVC_14210 [Myxococcota bacterium]
MRNVVPSLLAALLLPLAAAAARPDAVERTVRFSQIAEGGPGGEQVEHFEASLPPDPATAARGILPGEVLGEQRTLVTLVNFTNDPSTPYLTTDADLDILDDTNPTSTASYVLEASYGRAWLSGSVMGWLSAGYDDSSCLVRTFDGTQQLIDELDPLIDWSTVDRWIVVIPKNFGCGFLGYSTLGKWTFDTDEGTVDLSRIILNGPTHPWSALTAHELGHSFAGLQHSADWECGAGSLPPGCSYTNTDAYDVMASNVPYGHYTPSGKRALEWLDTNLTEVAGPGGTYWLEPYETVGTGTKVLRIPVQWPVHAYMEGEAYYVSYRKPLGFDAGFSELATDGAMLHLGNMFFPSYTTDATGQSFLIDARPGSAVGQAADSTDVLLEVGQSFVDTEHGITITTLAASGGEIQVQVTVTQYCGNGVLDPGEECDGSDFGGETCASVGFTSGTLQCQASCRYQHGLCGQQKCVLGHDFDDQAYTCTAEFLSVGPADMGLYQNWDDWSAMRHFSNAKLLTESRGFFGAHQHSPNIDDRDILWRMMLPFDTVAVPEGVPILGAKLHMTIDTFGSPDNNSHPDGADQLVLVQTNDPNPTVREKSDYGTFLPVDAPPEGAPRIDVSDTVLPQGEFTFELNATGLSWIDTTWWTKLGMRTAWDVDEVEVPANEYLNMNFDVVTPESPIQGPRLEVTYFPLPEPGVGLGLLAGAGLLGRLARRRR